MEEDYIVEVPAAIFLRVRANDKDEAIAIASWLLRRGAAYLDREWRGVYIWARAREEGELTAETRQDA